MAAWGAWYECMGAAVVDGGNRLKYGGQVSVHDTFQM